MNNREAIERELTQLEQGLKELQILYEQYFTGVEKREPGRDRQALAQRLRRLANLHMPQTDLRFRYQNLSLRFHSYAGYWDRILRLMDEGRFHRPAAPAPPAKTAPAEPSLSPPDPVDRLYRQLLEARKACKIEGEAISREKFALLLEEQKKKIQEKLGPKAVEFQVVTEEGKPKIKVVTRNRGTDVPGKG